MSTSHAFCSALEPTFANAQTALRKTRRLQPAAGAQRAHRFGCHDFIFDLGLWATNVKPLYKSKKAYRKLLEDQVDRLSDQQRMLYASNRHALLLVFQAMDTAGRDGAIRHVMSGVNPQGC